MGGDKGKKRTPSPFKKLEVNGREVIQFSTYKIKNFGFCFVFRLRKLEYFCILRVENARSSLKITNGGWFRIGLTANKTEGKDIEDTK